MKLRMQAVTLFMSINVSMAYADGDGDGDGDIMPVVEPVDTQILVEENSWEFRLSPYGWFAGLEGDVASLPGLPAMPIDVSSGDALDDTEASLMLVFEAKNNGHGFFIDAFYSDVQSEETLIKLSNNSLLLNSTTKTTMLTGTYMYELYKNENSVADVLAGVRYWNIDSQLSLSGGLGILPPGDHEESWVDPLIGIKGRTLIGDTKFYVAGGAAIGGFGIGSELFYDLNANIGYQWNNAIGTTVGYRIYDLDYENDGFVYDVKQQGWMMGLTWAF